MNTTEKFEYDIEFFNREKEKEEIMRILRAKPNFINFIYGPINSGKTTLITSLIDDLPKDKYAVFYINLRGKLIKEYGGFVRVLFKVKRKEISEKVIEKGEKLAKKALVLAGRYLSGIPIEKDMLDGFLETKSSVDVFEFLEEYFLKISEEKIPVLIIDELQVIGDLEINGKLIYKLFNFFIRLTKELHLCHVFALSSDSLFIERVYNEAMLEGRTNYILIDDFDEENAGKFLKKYKFKDINKAIKYFGGKPGDLRILLEEGKEINSVVQEKIAEKRRLISDMLDKLLYVKPKIEMEEGEEKIPVERDKVIEILKMFKDKEEIRDTGISRAEKIYLSGKNILFINPQKETIKIQSGIILTGIREILKEIDDNTLTIK